MNKKDQRFPEMGMVFQPRSILESEKENQGQIFLVTYIFRHKIFRGNEICLF